MQVRRAAIGGLVLFALAMLFNGLHLHTLQQHHEAKINTVRPTHLASFALNVDASRTHARQVMQQWRQKVQNSTTRNNLNRTKEGQDGLLQGPHFTVATHLTVDRAAAIEELGSRWKGPIVVCIYTRTAADVSNARALAKEHPHMRFQIVQANPLVHNVSYPVNVLRNAALQAVDTELAVMLDGDFVTSESLWEALEDEYEERFSPVTNFTAWVLPCFMSSQRPETPVPRTQDALLAAHRRGIVYYCNPEYQDAHITSTNHSRWWNSTDWYQVPWQFGYEPYVIVKTACAPEWDERFIFYGNDKVSHSRHLFEWHFSFVVLPFHFIIHIPHLPGKWALDERKAVLATETYLKEYLLFIDMARESKPVCAKNHYLPLNHGVAQVAPQGSFNYWPPEEA